MAARKDQNRRVKLDPNPARPGEIVTVKTLAEHEMEPGVRFNPQSLVVYPRFILNKIICRYNGETVFWADWFSGVSANPYLAFKIRADRTGPVEIEWIDDYNASTSRTVELVVAGDAVESRDKTAG